MQLLLASKSPRRRELLGQLGIPLAIVDVEVEERVSDPLPASQVAESLARLKAEAYKDDLVEGQVLVTADTVVVLGNSVLGKPHDHEEAAEMLRRLSGKAHQVYTGVCLRTARKIVCFTECTDVHFRPLSSAEIDYYIDTYKPYDKAGAYGIQEWIGMVGIERIEGCYYNVMGLPLARLYRELMSLTTVEA
ncbi:MAG: septum formation protein Maf [Bacteroidales bacterium]|nr:septum formation protein Maf [Bacteroidales bacterium]